MTFKAGAEPGPTLRGLIEEGGGAGLCGRGGVSWEGGGEGRERGTGGMSVLGGSRVWGRR